MTTMEKVMRAALAMQRHDWEQGVLAQAFLEAGEGDMATLLAMEGANRQLPDGRCCQLSPSASATDPCAIGEALLFARDRTGDASLAAACEGLLRWALEGAPRNEAGIVYHLCQRREFWVDSFYMLPPFLARAGRFDESLRQIDGWWAALYDEATGLLSHRWDDGAQTFARKALWGVGNGWAAAGLTRVIDLLPSGHPERERLVLRVRRLLEAMQRHQRPDGLFHDVLDDPASFPEVNCGQMFTYTVYRGVAAGWLDEALLPAAERARSAALDAVDDFGLVRGVCGAPEFDRPGIAAEGQAFFILMEAARQNLSRSSSTNAST